MSIADAIMAEARDIQDRLVNRQRGEELARELAPLLKASRDLGKMLEFDDQASDFAQVMLDSRTASAIRS